MMMKMWKFIINSFLDFTNIKVGKQVPTVVLQRPVEFQIKISKDCHDMKFQALRTKLAGTKYVNTNVTTSFLNLEKSRLFTSRHIIMTNYRQLSVSVKQEPVKSQAKMSNSINKVCAK